MKNDIELAMDGDSAALTRLYRVTETAESDDDLNAAMDAYLQAALPYAVGGGYRGGEGWLEFREIARKVNEIVRQEDELDRKREEMRKRKFERRVVESMESDDARVQGIIDNVKEFSSDEYVFGPGYVSEEDILAQIAYDEAWVNAATDCLAAKRFADLDKDVLVDLIEEVATQLDLDGDMDDDEEKDCLCENH